MEQVTQSDFVDVWYGELSGDETPQLYKLLSKSEQDKAEQFSRPHIKHKYINIRAIVRTILSRYVVSAPQDINIEKAAYGKPYLADEDCFFNLSHTDDQFALAVTSIGELGIDLEKKRERNNLSGLVNKCFSDAEALYWNSLTDLEQIEKFYSFWVRKEALVKAIGRGISLGLDQCEVDVENQDKFAAIPDNQGASSDWKIRDIQLKNNTYCALVTPDIEYKYKLIEYL